MTGSEQERDQILTDLMSDGKTTPEEAAAVYQQLYLSENPTAGAIPSFDAMSSDPGKFSANILTPIAGQMAGGIAGNVGGRALGRAIPALRGSGVAATLGRLGTMAIGEGVGTFAGLLGGRAATGEPLDTRNAAMAAFWQTVLSAGLGAAVPPAGRSGAVSIPASRAAVGHPDFTSNIPQYAESELARDIGMTARDLPKTASRANIESAIKQHGQAGRPFVEGMDIINEARKTIPSDVSPEGVSARARMSRDLDRLEQRIKQESMQNVPGPGRQVYPLTAEQADQIIRENMTQPISSEFERVPGGNKYTSARVDARNAAAQRFYKELGGTSSEDAAAASEALRSRKDVMDEFPLDEMGEPTPKGVANVAAAGSHTNLNAPVLLRKLERLDDWNRPNRVTGQSTMKDRVVDLGFRREWQSSHDAEGARILAAAGIASPQRITSPGWIRDTIRAIARLLVKSQGKTGAALRAGAVGSINETVRERQQKAFEDAMRRSGTP